MYSVCSNCFNLWKGVSSAASLWRGSWIRAPHPGCVCFVYVTVRWTQITNIIACVRVAIRKLRHNLLECDVPVLRQIALTSIQNILLQQVCTTYGPRKLSTVVNAAKARPPISNCCSIISSILQPNLHIEMKDICGPRQINVDNLALRTSGVVQACSTRAVIHSIPTACPQSSLMVPHFFIWSR